METLINKWCERIYNLLLGQKDDCLKSGIHTFLTSPTKKIVLNYVADRLMFDYKNANIDINKITDFACAGMDEFLIKRINKIASAQDLFTYAKNVPNTNLNVLYSAIFDLDDGEWIFKFNKDIKKMDLKKACSKIKASNNDYWLEQFKTEFINTQNS